MLWVFSFLSICLAVRECCYTPPCSFYELECETDFVIIGVGTAGSVLAKRLTDPTKGSFAHSFSAVGLEWGEYHNNDIEVKSISNPNNPFQFIVPSSFPEWSIDYMSAPDAGLFNKQVHISYGRMLGGSGNHNYAVAVHPSPRLLDEDWVPVGGEEWSSQSITKTINKYENYVGETEDGKSRGTKGPINVRAVQLDSDPNSFGNVFFQSLADNLPDPDSGTPIVKDANGGWDTYINNSPQFFYRFSKDEILRSSPGLDYTNTSVLSRKGFGVGDRKLRVKFGALVDKLLFRSRRAIGVQYIQNGESKIVYARKEIILTALAINTPVILQRSGYGPAALLESFGIDLIYDNPHVGQNLQNHYGGSFIVASNLPPSPGFIAQHAYLSILPEVYGRRLVQILLSPGLSGTGSDAFDAALGLKSLPNGWLAYGFLNFLVYPASRGSVQLTSIDPSIPPTVFPGFFSDSTERDIRASEQTLRNLYDNVNQLLKQYPDSFKVIYPPVSAFQEEGGLRTYIQGLPTIAAHWGGSCAMGSVVDEELSLIGVKGVTIADLSVAPVVNDGNTQTMANFIAEKAAKFLLRRYRE